MAGMPDSAISCHNHGEREGRYHCQWCMRFFCSECVRIRAVQRGELVFCSCGGGCSDITNQLHSSAERALAAARGARPSPQSRKDAGQPGQGNFALRVHLRLYLDVPLHPLRGIGWPLLALAVAAAHSGLAVLLFFPLGLPLTIILLQGYLAACLRDVLLAAADGALETPGWPDLTELFADLVRPGMLLFLLALPTLLPALVLFWLADSLPVSTLALLPGAFFFPMLAALVALTDSPAPFFKPWLLFASLARSWHSYLPMIALSALLWLASFAAAALLLKLPWLGFALAFLALFWTLCLQMRLAGLFYQLNQGPLEWF
jgi:hypothetical protein